MESVDQALARGVDAIVVGNTGPVHAARTAESIGQQAVIPVHDWFGINAEPWKEDRKVYSDPSITDEKSDARDGVVRSRAAGQVQPKRVQL